MTNPPLRSACTTYREGQYHFTKKGWGTETFPKALRREAPRALFHRVSVFPPPPSRHPAQPAARARYILLSFLRSLPPSLPPRPREPGRGAAPGALLPRRRAASRRLRWGRHKAPAREIRRGCSGRAGAGRRAVSRRARRLPGGARGRRRSEQAVQPCRPWGLWRLMSMGGPSSSSRTRSARRASWGWRRSR